MPSFSIDTESLLGISHSGEVTIKGTGTVELTDGQVRNLIDLIRKNGGVTDVKIYPEAPYEWDPVHLEYNVGIPAAIIRMSKDE